MKRNVLAFLMTDNVSVKLYQCEWTTVMTWQQQCIWVVSTLKHLSNKELQITRILCVWVIWMANNWQCNWDLNHPNITLIFILISKRRFKKTRNKIYTSKRFFSRFYPQIIWNPAAPLLTAKHRPDSVPFLFYLSASWLYSD